VFDYGGKSGNVVICPRCGCYTHLHENNWYRVVEASDVIIDEIASVDCDDEVVRQVLTE
jgi:hypothetical protein